MVDATYTTIDGDVVDAICARYYGTTAGRVVERVYEANPGLAELGAELDAGVVILLPALPADVQVNTVTLWD